MKKMKTMFKRNFDNHIRAYNEMEPECFWVLNDDVIATEKIDGSCTMIKNGVFYKRYDYKRGKTNLPSNAVPCQKECDSITGHFPHWVPVDEKNPNDKWFIDALNNTLSNPTVILENGTYEAVGPKFNGNPHNLKENILLKHGATRLANVPKDYDGLREYLKNNYIEGVVFYSSDGKMCKIKRSDFGFDWNNGKRNAK